MIKLINKSKINSEKLNEILNLLPNEYRSFDIEVRIYQNVFSLIKVILSSKLSVSPRDFYKILRLCVGGMYSGDKGDIVEIYLFNLPKEDCILHLTHSLFHEFRHLYQNKYRTYEGECIFLQNLKSTKDFKYYIHNEHEIDAEEFAYSFYNENKSEIDRIWEITIEYEIHRKVVEM